MKKIIPLFTFTVGLHLLLSAALISSDKVDNFMQLPAWMPSAVPAEDTFGYPARTNSASRRVTEKTLAATVAAFDALYERAFFSSEGRTNDWDEAEYGPREPCAAMMTNSFRSLFQYESWNTNGVPLVVADTRRLVDFNNISKFYDEAYLDAVHQNHEGRTLLDRGKSWNSGDRYVMFGCSKTIGEELPLEYDQWTSEGPEWMHFGKCFIPLASFDLGTMDPSNSYPPLSDDYRPAWVFCDTFMFDQSEAYEATGDIPRGFKLDDQFGYALGCPTGLVYDALYTPHSRRLLPDEYAYTEIEAEYEYLASVPVYTDVGHWKPWESGTPIREPWKSDTYYAGVIVDERFDPSGTYFPLDARLPDFPAVIQESWDLDFEFPGKTLPLFFGEEEIPPEATHCTLDYERGYPMFYFDFYTDADGSITNGVWDMWTDPPVAMTADLYREYLVTNSVTTNVSVLATIGREMAVMDRTYEVMQFDYDGINPSNENSFLRVIRTEGHGTGGKLQGPDSWVTGDFAVIDDNPFKLVFRPKAKNVNIFPPMFKTNEMAISVSVTTNGYVDTKRDRIRFHGADLYQSSWDFEGSTNHAKNAYAMFDTEGKSFTLPDGFHRIDRVLESQMGVVTVSMILGGMQIAFVTMDLSELDGESATIMIHAVMFVDGSYSWDITEEMTEAKAKHLYAFAGPTDRAFETKRVRDKKYWSYGGMGYLEDFSILRNGTMADFSIHFDLGYNDFLAHQELTWTDLRDPMRRQRTHYRNTIISEQFAADAVYARIAADRTTARGEAKAAVARRISTDLDDPWGVLEFEHAADLTTTLVTLLDEVSLTPQIIDAEGHFQYLAELKDGKIAKVHGVKPDPIHPGLYLTNEIDRIGITANLNIEAWDLIYSYANPPSLREDPPLPGRDPAHADTKTARIIWTDWDWKALKLETDENQ